MALLSSLQEEQKGRKEDSVAKQPADDKVRTRASCSCALAFLGGFDLIWVLLWLLRKFVASLASKGQTECQPTGAGPEPGVDPRKEPIGDGTVDIDVELGEPVDDSDSDIDMVIALLICAVSRKGVGFGHLCDSSGLLLCFGNAG
jgi:hypothetical protein